MLSIYDAYLISCWMMNILSIYNTCYQSVMHTHAIELHAFHVCMFDTLTACETLSAYWTTSSIRCLPHAYSRLALGILLINTYHAYYRWYMLACYPDLCSSYRLILSCYHVNYQYCIVSCMPAAHLICTILCTLTTCSSHTSLCMLISLRIYESWQWWYGG